MNTRHPGRILVAVLVAAAALVATPGDAGAERRAVAGSLTLSDAVVAPGTRVTATGSLPPRRARTVKLQVRRTTGWVTLATDRSAATGRFTFPLAAPLAAGARTYRVHAPATTLSGTRYPAASSPTRPLTVVAMTTVDAGWRHACSLGSNRRLWCWGDNTYGELGDGRGGSFDDANPQISEPVRVTGGGWTAVSTNGANTCGVKRDRTGWCWGDHAAYVLGVSKAAEPVQVSGRWTQLATGWFHVCGVAESGSGWCWGRDDGQLGSADPVPSGTRHQLPGTWTMIVPGSGSNEYGVACGVQSDHTAWCWGANASGQLGTGDTERSAVPRRVSGDDVWRSVTVGSEHACGITDDGAGWCWGLNPTVVSATGRSSSATSRSGSPSRSGGAALDAGWQHTCGVTMAGVAWCWGTNADGQLGDGTSETRYHPNPKIHGSAPAGPTSPADRTFTVGTSAGRARAWGRSDSGQTGSGASPSNVLTPRPVVIDP